MKISGFALAAALALFVGGAAVAQSPMHPMAPHHGFLPGHHPIGGPVLGRIVGNKRTHVYHLPGDRNLPAPQNRVYFISEAAAVRAGYHRAGAPHPIGRPHPIIGRPHSHPMIPAHPGIFGLHKHPAPVH